MDKFVDAPKGVESKYRFKGRERGCTDEGNQ